MFNTIRKRFNWRVTAVSAVTLMVAGLAVLVAARSAEAGNECTNCYSTNAACETYTQTGCKANQAGPVVKLPVVRHDGWTPTYKQCGNVFLNGVNTGKQCGGFLLSQQCS